MHVHCTFTIAKVPLVIKSIDVAIVHVSDMHVFVPAMESVWYMTHITNIKVSSYAMKASLY